uniref:HDC02496 n=1 Tax=Drosophila melanogaster TaxID=7227 RepID=Q6IHJ1_DROME|nr:TPA_inf: HDC02496 [Drosophila melanogaster]
MPLLLLTVKIQRRHSSHGGNIITRWRRMGRPSAVFINKKKKESPVFFGTLGPRQLAAEIMTGETLAAGWLLESGDSSGGKPKKRLRRILAFCCPPPRENICISLGDFGLRAAKSHTEVQTHLPRDIYLYKARTCFSLS